jgi:hypothetical protein
MPATLTRRHMEPLEQAGSRYAELMRLETIAQGRPLEALIAEAIEDYLRKNAMPPAPTS